MTAVNHGDWHLVMALADLGDNARRMVRIDGRQIAVFNTGAGVFACNNRCPHEGYPLSEGSVDGKCTLTCNWHNWKFDLSSGENLYGGDQLRVYPVQVREGQVWIDLSELPLAARQAQAFANLHKAFADNNYTWIARELARLRLLQVDAGEILARVVQWSYQQFEYGWTHAYAGMAEWLALHDEHPGDEELRLSCLLESVAHTADDADGEPEYPFAPNSVAFDSDGFLAAIEGEDEPQAVAMLRGALSQRPADQAWAEELEQVFARASLAHYNDFGHPLIYTAKMRAVLNRFAPGQPSPDGQGAAPGLLLSLLRDLVYATREDLIPEFHDYGLSLADWPRQSGGGLAPVPEVEVLHGLSTGKLMARLLQSAGQDPLALFNALVGLNARNLLSFDLAHQQAMHVPVAKNVSWLDFTHGITFADAVLGLCTRYPDLWPQGLLQLACFAGRNAAFAKATLDLARWHVADPQAFYAEQSERVSNHDCDEFIVSVHRLKTLRAAYALTHGEHVGEFQLSEEVASLVWAGVNRYLSTRVRLKQVRRTAYQARQFVALDG